MTTTLDIQRTLVLSTAHMPQWMARAMDNYAVEGKCRDDRMDLVAFDPVEYGYRVHVGEDPSVIDKQPPEIRPALRLALANNCTWVMFDCDGFTHSTLLPTYDWED